ncbi:MAG: hypothetical protein H6711_16200 [Myxococcales bacterium]|nr:hypothetical protein [Myxococcales bacterium]
MSAAGDDRDGRDDAPIDGEAELAALERWLAAALRSTDPLAARDPARFPQKVSEALRARVGAIQSDGLLLAARLVVRLRFERLVQGSPRASAWFDDDPRSFVAAFRRYHAEVPARAHFPADEAELFAAWLRAQSADDPGSAR